MSFSRPRKDEPCSEGKLVVTQGVVQRFQVSFLETLFAPAILIFEKVSIRHLGVLAEDGSRVLPSRIFGIDSGAVDQQMFDRSPVADMWCTREC